MAFNFWLNSAKKCIYIPSLAGYCNYFMLISSCVCVCVCVYMYVSFLSVDESIYPYRVCVRVWVNAFRKQVKHPWFRAWNFPVRWIHERFVLKLSCIRTYIIYRVQLVLANEFWLVYIIFSMTIFHLVFSVTMYHIYDLQSTPWNN